MYKAALCLTQWQPNSKLSAAKWEPSGNIWQRCSSCIASCPTDASDDNEASVGQDAMQVSVKHYVVDWLSMTQSERQCLAGRPHASLELPKDLSMWYDDLLVVRDVHLNFAPVPQHPAGVLSELPHITCALKCDVFMWMQHRLQCISYAKPKGHEVMRSEVQSLLSDCVATPWWSMSQGSAWEAIQHTVPQSTTGSLNAHLGQQARQSRPNWQAEEQ